MSETTPFDLDEPDPSDPSDVSDASDGRREPNVPDATAVDVDFESLYDRAELRRIERARIDRRIDAALRPEERTDAGAATGATTAERVDDRVRPGGPDAPDAPGGPDDAADPDQPGGPVGRMRRLGASGAVLAGVMLGIGEVFEPEPEKQTMIEFAPDRLDEDEQLVTFRMVPDDPRASRLVIRPWLLDGWRTRHDR